MTSRRRFLAISGAAGTVGLAGCNGALTGNGDDGDGPGQIGSGRAGRGAPGGTPMSEMPDLEGEVTVYSGRSEVLVGELVGYIGSLYDDLDLSVRYGSANDMVTQIQNEGDTSPADVFYSVNAGALGLLAESGRTAPLPEDVAGLVREEFRDDDDRWTGTSGRARSIPFNTEALSEGGIPDDIMAFPEEDRFDGEMGWAPGYGSFQAFVTAMRLLEGEAATREWLEGMVDSGVRRYPDEFQICQAIADGDLSAGFTNHYYVQRVSTGGRRRRCRRRSRGTTPAPSSTSPGPQSSTPRATRRWRPTSSGICCRRRPRTTSPGLPSSTRSSRRSSPSARCRPSTS